MSRRRRYEGLKVRLDRDSGEVNLRIPYGDLREVFTAAALHCYDSIERASGRRAPEEARAYSEGLLAKQHEWSIVGSRIGSWPHCWVEAFVVRGTA